MLYQLGYFGTGTTGAVAKRLGRQWIGIEKEPGYVEIARRWIEAIVPDPPDAQLLDFRRRRQPSDPAFPEPSSKFYSPA